MSDDFGLEKITLLPVLERIGREERLDGDQPRKPRGLSTKRANKNPESTSPDTTQATDDSISSPRHIDLRI